VWGGRRELQAVSRYLSNATLLSPDATTASTHGTRSYSHIHSVMADSIIVSLLSVSESAWQVLMSTTQGSGADALEETLGRLNKKSGVKATIVLDRTTGAILKTSGQISSIRTSKNPGGSSSALPTQTAGSFATESNAQGGDSPAVEELAGMVWNFVNNAGDLIHDLDTEVRRFGEINSKRPNFADRDANTVVLLG